MKAKFILFMIVILFTFNVGTYSSSAEQMIDATENTEQTLSDVTEEQPVKDGHIIEEPNTDTDENEKMIEEPIIDEKEMFTESIVQNLIATTSTATTVKLSWSAMNNATSYEVYQSVNSESVFILVGTVSSTSYTLQNIVPGATNYFKVRAAQNFEDTTIYSQYSNIVSAKTTLATPSNFKVANKTYNSVTLSWSKVTGAKGYEIYMATSKNGKYTKVKTTSATSFKHTNLTTNKTYYYKIRAYSQDTSTYFSQFSNITSATISLATPSNFKVTNKTYNSVTLSWSKVTGAKGYEIYMATSKNGKYTKVKTTTASSFKHTNLTTNKTYYYKIRAYSGNKPVYSPYSSITSATISLATPSKFKIANKTYNSVTLSWSKVTGAKGYEIYMATSKNGKYTKVKTTTASSFKHTNLTTNKTYYYKIRAYVKNSNKTSYSSYAKVIGKPVLNTVPSVKTKGSNSYITVSWGTVSGATNYKVYRSTSKNGKFTLIKTTKSNSYADKSVKKRTTYYYKIVATRNVGKKVYNSASSAVASGITKAILKPDISIYTSDQPNSSTSVVVFLLENHGPKPIKILSTGALIDDDYESFDRLLQQIDTETLKDLEWLQIGGNRSGYVAYRVIGSPTWYDDKSTIAFEFMYDGVKYLGIVSNYYGFSYVKY